MAQCLASLVAVAIVTSMVLWMRGAAASISGDLRAGLSRALETGALAVVALAFLAVGREGLPGRHTHAIAGGQQDDIARHQLAGI